MNRTTPRPRIRRVVAAASAAALAAVFLPTAAAADEHDAPDSRGFDRVCPAPDDAVVDDPADPDDVEGTTHEEAIQCALDYGLVLGFLDDTYRPNTAVTRGQMATFVANWVTTATGTEFEPVEDQPFTDVEGTTHEEGINQLADAEIVSGRADGTFGPNDAITRGQMARFISGAIDFADTMAVDGSLPPSSDTEFFSDVSGTTFEAEIRAIAAVGIVQGFEDGTYRPNDSVTRGQLATFQMAAGDYLDRHQRWEPTAVTVTYEVELSGEAEVDDSGPAPVFGVGEPGATGLATITIDAFAGELTVDLDYEDVTGPFDGAPGAHIHEGAIDENGPIVVGFATGDELEAGDGSLTTTVVEDVTEFRFAELIEDPDSFYVNVHSDDYPAGAVRGQLPDGGLNLLEPTEFTVTMTGEAEVDDSGDEPVFDQGELGASAEATVEVDYVEGEITYTVDISDVTGPFDEAPGFHIHVGAEDENGPIVAFLADGDDVAAAEATGTLSGTFTAAPPSVLRQIIDDPENHYLNLHSNDYPAGAVRAQLG